MSKSFETVESPTIRTKFFGDAPDISFERHIPTLLNVQTTDSEGNSVVELQDIDTIDDSLKCLKYTDFEIHNLLKAGVKLHPISIGPDTRLGVTDAMIEDYNSRLETIANDMFESKSE